MFKFFKSKKKTNEGNAEKDNNPYVGLRNLALNISPDELGVKLDKDDQVYGAVVDMDINGNVATMACLIDGTASLYFSTGGGILGSGQHESVHKAVVSYLVSIHQVLHIMNLTNNFDAKPQPNHHVFYLLTRTGVYMFDLDINDDNKSKEAQYLFALSQMVLNEIRKVNDKKTPSN